MAGENFDPGERFAATAGLRGAYDGEDSVGTGGGFDTSWVDDGYGVTERQNYSIADLAKLFDTGGQRLDMTQYGGLLQNAQRPVELTWLPNNSQFRFGDLTGDALTQKLTDLYGADGLEVFKTMDVTNPRKTQTVYRAGGNTIGQRDHKESPGFFNKYSGALTKLAGGAIAGAGIGALFGAGGVAGGGLSTTASGGGTGAGLSAGAATGGTGAGLGSGAYGAFGTGSTGLGSLVGGSGGLAEAFTRAGFNTLMNGGDLGDFGKAFGSNLIPGIDMAGMGDFGEYGDLVNRTLKGAAMGGIRGGGQGALMGGAAPLLNEGINQVGDYFSQNPWEQDSFGSGGMSTNPMGQGSLQGYFNNFTGTGQQGPMSTTAGLQSSGGGGQLDWNSILGGQQAFGNTETGQQEVQPNAFGLGAFDQPMDFQNGVPGFESAAVAPQADAGSWGQDELRYLKQVPEGLKAFLVAQNPKYAALFGQSQKMNPMQAGLGALGTLYAYNRANKDLKAAQKQLAPQGQNSPYMKAMRQALERKDAAAGRRSQYGPREVDLQARLAEFNGRNAPYLAQIAGAQNQNRIGAIGQLLGYADRSGLDDSLISYFTKNFGGG